MRPTGSRAYRPVVLFGLAVVLAGSPTVAQYVERVDVSVANIDVVVTDRDGNPVRGLTRDDFQVYEDGKLQTITNFSAIEADRAEAPAVAGDSPRPPVAVTSQPAPPRLIVMFIDIDDIEPIRRRQFFEGIREFLDSSFREGDLFTLFTWNRRVRVAMPPTSSRAQVEALMDGLATSNRWSDSEILTQAAEAQKAYAVMDAEFATSLGMGDVGLDPQADAAFQDWILAEQRCEAIKRKATELKALITSLVRVDMHKVLVFASDDLSLSPSRDCSTARELDSLAEAANAYGMTIHAFHPPGQRERRVGYGPDTRPGTGMPGVNEPTQMSVEANKTFEQATGLLRLAELTGGLSGVGAGMSARRLEQAATELDNYYSIGYHFSEGNEDAPRQVRVTTKNPAYRVRVRQSVVRLSETSRLRDELTANLYLPPQIQSQSPAFDVKIAGTERDGRFSQVHLELSILARDLVLLTSADEKRRGSFSVFVVGGRELGDASPVAELKQDFEAETDAGDSRVVYAFATRVRPDTRRLSIAVRDNVSGEVATKVVMLTGSGPDSIAQVDPQPKTPVTEAVSKPAAGWPEAVQRARAEEKPIVAITGPANCPSVSRTDPCRELGLITSHPAMQRRLSSVVFLPAGSSGAGESAVALFDPAGNLVLRWSGVPDLTRFQQMLDLIDGAAPLLADAYRAAVEQNQPAQLRSMALALLALGQPTAGRKLLEALASSTSVQDQQFASLWLEQLDAHSARREPREDLLTELARNGSTNLVRFDSWLALGNLRVQQGRHEEAALAYRSALELAPSGQRKAALVALQKAEALVSPIVGLDTPGSIIAGRRKIGPRVIDDQTAKVEYRLDGRLIATADRSPFTTTVNFGGFARRRTLTLDALGRAGRLLERITVVINRKSDELSVEIVEPSSTELSGSVDVNVVPLVPYGRSVESLVVEWNGARVASFTSPPYRTRIDVSPGQQGVLRAALRLDDGSEVEDVLLANSGEMMLESEVSLVEVPVYVEEGELTAQDVIVREAAQQRGVDRVAPPSDTPLRVAVVFDASRRSEGNLLDIQEAVLSFLDRNLLERDKFMMVVVNNEMRILWPTDERDEIERAVLSIQAGGRTPLRDAMMTALLQIPATGSRRALIVFSDGVDSASLFTQKELAEVSRQSGVPIYYLWVPAPGDRMMGDISASRRLDRGPQEVMFHARRDLSQLSRTSGGKEFQLDSLDDLDSIWTKIGEDLQKQSLVIYRTDPSGAEWRPIEVSVRGGGKLRAPAGVYVASGSDE